MDYKLAAKRLRARLHREGVDLSVAQSLEAIAAIFDKPNWDALAPLNAKNDAAAAPLPFRYFGVRSGPAPSGLGRTGSVTCLVGHEKAGKTLTALAIARLFAMEAESEVVYLDVAETAAQSEQREDWLGRAIDVIVPLRNKSKPAVLVLDGMSQSDPNLVRSLLITALAMTFVGVELVLVVQGDALLNLVREIVNAERQEGLPRVKPAIRSIYMSVERSRPK